jgi:hypothetical protein
MHLLNQKMVSRSRPPTITRSTTTSVLDAGVNIGLELLEERIVLGVEHRRSFQVDRRFRASGLDFRGRRLVNRSELEERKLVVLRVIVGGRDLDTIF